ncbi:Uncharacterised protein [Mycobacteroides abscessus subsp. abscessus]|nr:Uncharacterised protein [Mycobacteroides abscessus subsp. abscessus]
MSKTDSDSREIGVATKGLLSRPGYDGSEYTVTGSSVSRSPMRVPPGPAKALRPSCAPRPPMVHTRYCIRSPVADGGSSVS